MNGTVATGPERSAAVTSASASAAVIASGFSQTTCLPAARAASASGAWRRFGVQTWTTSTPSAAASSSGEPKARSTRRRLAASRARSGRDSELRLLGLHVDAVQAGEVLTEDLALRLLGELRVAALLDDVARQLEVPERLERPLRVPDRRLAAVDDLVLAAPPQHLAEHLGEDPRLAGDEVHRRRDRRVEVRVADDLPQHLVHPRQAH